MASDLPKTLSIIVPCYNEESTLKDCIDAVQSIASSTLMLDIIIVDDASTDESPNIASKLATVNDEVRYLQHDRNQGKGAALRTGIKAAKGDYVAIQDADLEYDPNDLPVLLEPLLKDQADVVLGSRFLTDKSHRVLFFWHSMGNKLLTLLSNMFTDLNLTDMETCYKVFRRDVIQGISIQENRFGFEPEVVAKIADMRCRVFEMGISYRGRTYEEGKKIGVRDGFRALYCIVRYNAHRAPLPIQFMFYVLIGGIAAIVNLAIFMVMRSVPAPIAVSALTAFVAAAAVNYALCIKLLFRQRARWQTITELLVYSFVVLVGAAIDVGVTVALVGAGLDDVLSKLIATATALIFNFIGRRFLVFPERARGPWEPTRSQPNQVVPPREPENE